MSKASFPDHLIDPNLKDEKWVSDYIRAAWDNFKTICPNVYYQGGDHYKEIRDYMLGRQSVNKYKKSVTHADRDANNDENQWNIDWTPLAILKKFRQIAVQRIKKMGYRMSADAVDPLAVTEKDQEYKELASRLMLREELVAQGMDPSLVQIEHEEIRNIEELKIHFQHRYKHRYSYEIEQGLELVRKRNKFDVNVRDKVRLDLHDFGIGGVFEGLDPNGEIVTERIPAGDIVVGYSERDDFSDAPYKGRVKMMTIGDLRQDAHGELSQTDFEEIAEKCKGKNSNPQRYDNRKIDHFKIEVLELEFESINDFTLEKRKDSRDNEIVGRGNYQKSKKPRKSRTHKNIPFKVLYTGKWVLGTEKFYKCHLQKNMNRRNHINKNDVYGSFHFRAIELDEMVPSSTGETLVPFADAIQIAWFKLQQTVLKARPKGVAINWDAVSAVQLGAGGSRITEESLLDLYNQSGSLLYSLRDSEDNMIQQGPIQELVNGLGDDANQWYNLIRTHIQLIRDTYGFNEITDGSTPKERTLNGVAQLATESTVNALSHISDAEKALMEEVDNGLAMRIQRAIKNGSKIEGYVNALGKNTVEFFSVHPDVSLYDWGIFIEELPTDDKLKKIYDDMTIALQADQITIADKIEVEQYLEVNLRLASSMLSYKIKENEEKARQQEVENIELNSKTQQESAMVAAQAEAQNIQLESNAKLAQIQLEKDLELRNLQVQLSLKHGTEEMIQGSKEAQKQTETESREYIEDKRLLGRNNTETSKE